MLLQYKGAFRAAGRGRAAFLLFNQILPTQLMQIKPMFKVENNKPDIYSILFYISLQKNTLCKVLSVFAAERCGHFLLYILKIISIKNLFLLNKELLFSVSSFPCSYLFCEM